jgi:hypothetical protein
MYALEADIANICYINIIDLVKIYGINKFDIFLTYLHAFPSRTIRIYFKYSNQFLSIVYLFKQCLSQIQNRLV